MEGSVLYYILYWHTCVHVFLYRLLIKTPYRNIYIVCQFNIARNIKSTHSIFSIYYLLNQGYMTWPPCVSVEMYDAVRALLVASLVSTSLSFCYNAVSLYCEAKQVPCNQLFDLVLCFLTGKFIFDIVIFCIVLGDLYLANFSIKYRLQIVSGQTLQYQRNGTIN